MRKRIKAIRISTWIIAFALIAVSAEHGFAQKKGNPQKKERPKQTQPVQKSQSSSQQSASSLKQGAQSSSQAGARRNNSTSQNLRQPMQNPARRPAPVKQLPTGYKRVNFGGKRYYHHNGIYYRRVGDTFRVIRPPVGMRVTLLPPGAIIVYYGNSPYYYYYGVYYLYDPLYEAYVIVDKPSSVVYSDSDQTVAADVSNDELYEDLNLPTPGFDRLVLIDGSSVEGTYLGGTPTSIMIEVGGDTLNIAISKIVTIDLAAVTDDTSGVSEDDSLLDDEIIDDDIFEDSE